VPGSIDADVYVVGFEYNGTVNVAKLWKNGIATNISDGTKNATATGVFVKGNDVYVSFTEGVKKRAKLWHNGAVTTLPFPDSNDPFTESGARGVSEGVVVGYHQVASTGRFVAAYWGETGLVNISNAATDNAEASAIHIKTINNFTRTSICGSIKSYNTTAETKTFFWGGQFSNPSFNIYGNALATSISNTCFINDNGFTYIGGRYNTPTIWMEGSPAITLANNNGAVSGLYVVGNTSIYAVGNEFINGKNVAKLWSGDYRTGQLTSTNITNGQYEANASSVQVVDDNTFIAGNEFDSNGKVYAKYWKNGVTTIVGDATSYATAIYVVKK
jgi:hypothetical protein